MDDLLAAESDRKISMSPSTFSYLARLCTRPANTILRKVVRFMAQTTPSVSACSNTISDNSLLAASL